MSGSVAPGDAGMRAAVVRTPGGPFVVADAVSRRAVGTTDVVVRVHAAGICHTDLSLAGGAFGQTFPVVLGHEGAGEVVEIGSGVTDVAVGQRVVISWVPSCGRCYTCVRGETYICLNRPRSSEQGAALTVDGEPVVAGMGTATFAEETVVPARSVIPVPDDVPFDVAALLGCAVPTGFGAAVDTARVAVGETVLVVGCGAVGLNAVQGARIAGAAVIVAVDPAPARRALAVELGATVAVAPGADGPGAGGPDVDVRATLVAAGGAVGPGGAPVGFDVAIDAVGVSGTIRSAWDATRRGGRVVVVGAGRADDMVPFGAQELFHEQKSITGSFYGSSDMRRQVPRMVDLWRSGALRLDAFLGDQVDLDGMTAGAERQRRGESLRVVVRP